MGAIFGFLSREEQDSSLAERMLRALERRGPHGWGVAYENFCVTSDNYDEVDALEFRTRALVGHAFLDTGDAEKFPKEAGDWLAVDGNLYSEGGIGKLAEAAKKRKLKDALAESNGDFSLALLDCDKFLLARSPLGTKPLFYGKRKGLFAFSSDPRVLNLLEIRPNSLVPGELVAATLEKTKAEPFFLFGSLPSAQKNEKSEIKKLLEAAVRKRVGKVKGRVAVMFSGGLDSSVLVVLASKYADVLLLTVGAEGAEDLEWAEKIAKKLKLPLETKILSKEEILSLYSRVQEIFPQEFLRAELGAPLLACAEMAKKEKCRVMLAGQGAEELFAGYERHRECHARGGNLRKMLAEELRGLYRRDLERNDVLSLSQSVEVRTPFLDVPLARAALSVPPEQNVSAAGKKLLLSEIAKELGVPRDAAERKKRAMQYGSGVHRILLRHLKK